MQIPSSIEGASAQALSNQKPPSVAVVIDAPVTRMQRYAGLDILRGFAVFAIFAVNIKAMAAPFSYYANASLWPGQFDMIVSMLQAFLIDDKWRTIFTALFGAGIILIAEKTDATGGHPRGRLATRNAWLLLFGLIHMIGIWIGDILTNYAVTGFIAMAFWKKSSKSLWIWSIGIFIIAYIWTMGMNMSLMFVPEAREGAMPVMWLPDAVELQRSKDIFLSTNPLDHIAARAFEAPFMLFVVIFGGFTALTLSIMLAGMALWKNGFLKGEWSVKNYVRIAVVGLAIAVLTDIGRWVALIDSGWDFDVYLISILSNEFNGLAGGIGYAALIMALVKSGTRFPVMANVGRMAFTNYITCSVIGTTIAGGHGLGLYTKLTNLQLMGIVVVTWFGLAIFSTIWLSIFRFGPLEWLWRSLSYRQLQPLLRQG